MANLSARKASDQDTSIVRHTITSLKEKVELQNCQKLKINSDYAVKQIESDQLEQQISDYKMVVADAYKKLAKEKNVLEKQQKTVWKERSKFEEQININEKDTDETCQNTERSNNNKHKIECRELQGEINSLKFYQTVTTNKIEELKDLINDLKIKKEKLILSLPK